MFPVLYSHNEPVYFLGIFASWIRIRMDRCMRHIFIRIHVDLDPKHCLKLELSFYLSALSFFAVSRSGTIIPDPGKSTGSNSTTLIKLGS